MAQALANIAELHLHHLSAFMSDPDDKSDYLSRQGLGQRTTTTPMSAFESGAPAFQVPEESELTMPVFAEETTQTSTPLPITSGRIPCITVLAGPEEGQSLTLEHGSDAIIGRGPDCRLRLTDSGVSRQHTRIFEQGGDFFAQDLGSTNGTFVGERRITSHPLKDNDMVRVGTTTIVKFRLMDPLEANHFDRVMAAALRDSLTGLFNRRCFDERLAAEFAASRRHNRELAFMIFDIDNFKKVNDNFGHVVGDGLLRSIATAIKNGVRTEDLAFRYGGEEFAVIARETSMKGAVLLAERLRQAVAATKSNGLRATVSIGVACLNATMTMEQLIEIADARLYVAKHQGKNRVVFED